MTNEKSCSAYRMAPIAMTLSDLKHSTVCFHVNRKA